MIYRLACLSAFILVLNACGSSDNGRTTAGTSTAGTTDTGTSDTGSTDTGSTTDGTTDSGTTDSGTTDGGTTDSGTTDGGTTDGGTTDGGTTDGSAGNDGWSALSGGGDHSCGIWKNGELWCWGDNSVAALGNSGFEGETSIPIKTQLSGVVTSVSSGWGHSCAIDDKGVAWCWGENTLGQCGDGTSDQVDEPTMVKGLESAGGVVSISGGAGHSCAATGNGQVWCWGLNEDGELGDGTNWDHIVAKPSIGITGAVQVALSSWHSCARTDVGDVYCWGDNYDGIAGETAGSDLADFPRSKILRRVVQPSAAPWLLRAASIVGARTWAASWAWDWTWLLIIPLSHTWCPWRQKSVKWIWANTMVAR